MQSHAVFNNVHNGESVDSVASVKAKLCNAEGVPPNQERLVLGGAGGGSSNGDATIQIFVKSLGGRTLTLDVAPHDTVADVKDKIYAKDGVKPSQQRLVFSGKNLDDTRTLAD